MDAQVESFLEAYFTKRTAPSLLNENPNWRMNLTESGVIDSLAIVELMVALEENFSIKILDEDITVENFSSFPNLKNFVIGKVR